ncbi:MAG: 3-deoxy-D-manno-octulosonic acid transferase [Janthinobacterium lividum]
MRGLSFRAWSLATGLAAPGLRLMLRRRARRGKEIADRLPEREGIDPTPRPPGRLVWFHAASMGEARSILPVLQALPSGLAVLVTTGTVTSAALLEGSLPALKLAWVVHRFVPLDVPGWVARFVAHWRPDVGVFVESELWPNLLSRARDSGAVLLLINARISAHSLRGWRRAPGTVAQLLGVFTRIHPQSTEDADHLRLLGARSVTEPGNLKLSAPPLPADPAELARLRHEIGDRPVWLAASTHPGEEAIAAAVHRRLLDRWPTLLTIIAPRHVRRGAELGAGLQAPRRSVGEGPPQGAGLWIVDTMEELGLLYRLAPIVFVGKSLAGEGGQNPLEAARLGCAVAMGPHTGNFLEPVRLLSAAGALAKVDDEAGLADWVDRMLSDSQTRTTMGEAARTAAAGDSALPGRLAAMIVAALPP